MPWDFIKKNDLIRYGLKDLLTVLKGSLDADDCEIEIRNAGNLVGDALLGALHDTLNKIKDRRTWELVRVVGVVAIWKCLFDTAYRAVMYDYLYNLLTRIDPDAIEKYRKDPKSWAVNKKAAFTGNRRKK
jgi:hypothetical protein